VHSGGNQTKVCVKIKLKILQIEMKNIHRAASIIDIAVADSIFHFARNVDYLEANCALLAKSDAY